MRSLLTSSLIFSIVSVITAKTKEEWLGRSIYQLLTDRFATSTGASANCKDIHSYCGGDFRGIINNLDYIQGMGFNAIWISPVVENYDYGYHGYDAKNIYKINQRFGGEDALHQLVDECHKRDIWVIVDVVANHMGNLDRNFAPNFPFNKAEHYHEYCLISDDDFTYHNLENIRRCRLAGLADLDQDNPEVRAELLKWIKWLVTTFKFDGIRVDTVPQVHPDFWTEFSAAAGVYNFGEVFDSDKRFLAQFVGPLNSVLNYPLFYKLRDLFLHWGSMASMKDYYDEWVSIIGGENVKYLTNFNDNHDNIRFLNNNIQTYSPSNDKRIALRSIVAWVLTSVGVPIIYYGTEQEFSGGIDPLNREVLWGNLNTKADLYQFIGKVNAARNYWQMGTQPQVERWRDDDLYAYTRGQALVAFTNKQDRQVHREITYHPYKNGDLLCNVLAKGDCVRVENGSVPIYLNYGEVKLFTPAS